MKDQESLQPVTLLTDFLDPVHCCFNLLFADGVVTPGIVVSCIFLASDQLLSAEQLAVGASTNLICK